MTQELLPCPFCGVIPSEVWHFANCYTPKKGNHQAWAVKHLCAAGHGTSRNDAIAAWNRRAPQWQPIETAPMDEVLRVKAGEMTFLAALRPDASLDEDSETCAQWQAENEGEHPPCWSGGACWGANEDGIPSLQPTAWQPK